MPNAKTPPSTFLQKLAFIGPGMVLAALAIGSGELVLTPRSGARFGFALLWVPVLTIVYKAVFSESLARLTIASGDDVFSAFNWLPGPKHWAQYFIIVVFSLDMIGYGGIALALGSAVKGLFPEIDIRLAAICATVLVPILLYTGSYNFFERIVVGMCAVLIAGIVYTLFHVPLPAGQIVRGLVPSVPSDSLATIMGLMGWVGAGTTTLLYSSWVNEKTSKAENEQDYRAWISTMRLDCFASYTLILAISFAFLAMGVATLHTQGIVPEKHQMMSQLACMLDSFRGGRETFLVVAFFSMFSTIVSCMDGKSRAIASILEGVSPKFGNKLGVYRIAMGAYLAIMVVTILLGDNQPGAVINLVAAMNAVVFGGLGFVLLYLDRRLPKYARCHPIAWCVLFVGSLVFLGVSVMKVLG